jgi:MHS family alpha-ketoglutarate permease-like MFS transporter
MPRTASLVMTAVLFVYIAAAAVIRHAGRPHWPQARPAQFHGADRADHDSAAARPSGRSAAPLRAFGLILAALLIVSFYTSISGLVKAELFPTEVRAIGVGLSYAIGNALFGGSAEYVALWFKQAGNEQLFYYYVCGMAVLGLLAVLWMPDSRRHNMLGHEDHPVE